MSEIIPGIFKAYDIRGLYPGEIHEMVAHEIGGAYVTYLKAKRIGVSRDMRVSSPAIMDAFVAGARGQGCDVIDYGMQATDMLYFAVVRDDLDGGVQITASHNPKQYNGIKMVKRGAAPLSGDEGIGEIRDMVVAKATPPKAPRAGALTQANVLDDYTKTVMGFIDQSLIKPFNVVLDAANGMAGLVAPKLFDQLPCKTTRLAFTPDGTFPNYEANPLIEENRKVVTERVLREKADIGIAWDGDADRVFFIDGNGEFIAGDFITALLAEAFLIRQPGQAIVYDVRASYAVKDTVARYNGSAHMNRVGHAFFKGRMRETNSVFGGEVTGHYYFRDFYYCDNGFIPALLILELMSRKNQTLAQLLEPLRQKYFISGEINSTVEDQDGKMQEIAERFSNGEVSWLDGVSVDCGDWHFNDSFEFGAAAFDLHLQRGGADAVQFRLRSAVSAEFNSISGPSLDRICAHQADWGAAIGLIPDIGLIDVGSWHKHDRFESMLSQDRKGVVDKICVRIIEGNQDWIFGERLCGFTPRDPIRGINRLVSVVGKPLHLKRESSGVHRQPGVSISLERAHLVIHQNRQAHPKFSPELTP